MKNKLNVGCGRDIRSDFVNLDVAPLPGVDVVHNLQSFPWPFKSNSFEAIHLLHVLEHLPDTIKTLEELHRVSRPGATILIRVPFWNSPDMLADPTHMRAFSERTLNFIDPNRKECIDRPYYSTARFQIAKTTAYVKCFFYVKVSWRPLTAFLFFLARYLGAIVWVIEFELSASKE